MKDAKTIREGSQQLKDASQALDSIKSKDPQVQETAAKLKIIIDGALAKSENHPENNKAVANKIGEYLVELGKSDDKKSKKTREAVYDALTSSSPAIRSGVARAESGTANISEAMLAQLTKAKGELETMQVGEGRGQSLAEQFSNSQKHRTASGRDLRRWMDGSKEVKAGNPL